MEWKLAGLCLFTGTMLFFYVCYTHVRPYTNRKELETIYKEQMELFLSNMDTFNVSRSISVEVLQDIETFEELKRANKLLEKQIKKYNL